MSRPDFAHVDIAPLGVGDLQFLIDNFPQPARTHSDIARVIHHMPTTVESMLDSRFVVEALLESRELVLRVSPFLWFNVLLRRALPTHRTRLDRQAINYLANLLSLFVDARRVQRVQPDDTHAYTYLWELVAAAEQADESRRFLVYSHIGNYSLYLSGMFNDWLEHRYRFGRRPLNINYYIDFGRTYFDRAADHRMAREFQLEDVFGYLAAAFDDFRRGLMRLARRDWAFG